MNFLEITPYVFGSQLTWYSVLILIGAILAYIISDYFYKKDPESKKCPDLMLNTLLVAFPSGLVGARIWYVLSEWTYYFNNPIEILKVWEGGLAIQGGVMLGAGVGIWYVWHIIKKCGLNLKVTKIMDFVIPNILIAQVIGRWGNFFNREVYGACVNEEQLWFLPNFIKEYMRGGYVSEQYVACPTYQYAQPLFLYEGLLNLIGFILISIVLRKFFKKRVDGTLSAFYLIWYGTVRASLEGFRNERFIMRWGNLSQSLITSIIFVLIGSIFLIYLYLKDVKKDEVELVLIDSKNVVKEDKIGEATVVAEKENSEVKPVKKTAGAKATNKPTTTKASASKTGAKTTNKSAGTKKTTKTNTTKKAIITTKENTNE